MKRGEFLKLMQFPAEWDHWGMLPAEYMDRALNSYEAGHESAPEHDRHGFFQWWLRQSPSPDQLVKLARLAWLDPDQVMGESVRTAIAAHPNSTPAVDHALRSNPGE